MVLDLGLGRGTSESAARVSGDPSSVCSDGELLLLASPEQVRIDGRLNWARSLGLSPDLDDRQLLLGGWRRRGAQMVDRLAGDFAFVLWDGVERVLFAARDPMGARELHYRHEPGRLSFASQASQLLGTCPEDLDGVYFADFLVGQHQNRVRTPYAGIQKLLPGHALRVEADTGEIRCWRYWNPCPQNETELTEREAIDSFRAAVYAAVEDRLGRWPGPAAIALSGGLDSSTLAVVAGDLARRGRIPRPLLLHETFSRTRECDESAWARPVAEAAGLELVELDNDALAYDPLVLDPTDSADSPVQSRDMVFERRFRRILDAGCSGVINGYGGDSLFDAGRLQHLDLLADRRWQELLPWIRGAREAGRSWLRSVGVVVVYPSLPEALRRRLDRLRQGGRFWPVPDWLHPDLSTEIERVGSRERESQLPFSSLPPARHRQLQDLMGSSQLGHAVELWQSYAHRFGLRMSYPLLDRRLAELVLSSSLSVAARPGPGGTKWLLREATRGLLPELVRTRPDKVGWKAFYDRAIFGDEMAWNRLFADSRADELRLLDRRRLTAAFRSYRQSSNRLGTGAQLYCAVLVEKWLRVNAPERSVLRWDPVSGWQGEGGGRGTLH